MLSGQITLECEVMNRKQTLSVNIADVISTQRVLSANTDLPLHRLAGKVQLDELSDQHKAMKLEKKDDEQKAEMEPTEPEQLQKKIEQLSCALNIISPFTAFVGVDPVKLGQLAVFFLGQLYAISINFQINIIRKNPVRPKL
ncbi:hypothetical protein FBUS_07215 [Fasciolopsis buskii]|uniref:Uncharacterized protein n=1 Tax=Fasciolopsis buskii TaxID=27845 RepID=A0A8E0VL34_9TREM|nr:hypothetical protein FBUS_07215 [Fasciolopsis buski]